jgi:hypothetical protein
MLYSALGNNIPLGPRLWCALQVGGPRTEPAPGSWVSHIRRAIEFAPDCMIMDNLE